MNHSHLTSLCEHFNFGSPRGVPQRVHGGLLHIMWRLDTDKGSYAIKQLSQDIAPDEKISRITERIAARFAEQGIPAVSAIKILDKYLFMQDGVGFLVYPWVEAKALDQHAISEKHALKIAVILAKMHSINLDEPEITEPIFYTHTNKKILALLDKAESFNCPFIGNLRKYQRDLLASNDAYQAAILILKTHFVVSHGDLDQKNVLWDAEDNPILIDWEAACKINPTYDIINTAFYWSGITSNFDKDLFFKMVSAYQSAGGVVNKAHVMAACNGAFNWIGWLVYNIERSCVESDSEHKRAGIEQVEQTINTLLRLREIIPEIIEAMEYKL